MATDTMHTGRKISRIRELKGIKQETLATLMGISQQAVSKLEQSEHVDEERLEEVGKALGVTSEIIKNFNEDTAIQIFSNTYHDHASSVAYNFNPIEKIVELYERMLQLEKEKNELLEQMLDKNKKS